jgi:hypothetical protein
MIGSRFVDITKISTALFGPNDSMELLTLFGRKRIGGP